MAEPPNPLVARGRFYRGVADARRTRADLTSREMPKICEGLVNRPVRYEHCRTDVGRVRRAWMNGRDAWAEFEVGGNTQEARVAARDLIEKRVAQLSLGHRIKGVVPDGELGDGLEREADHLAVCWRGARPDTCVTLVNASEGATEETLVVRGTNEDADEADGVTFELVNASDTTQMSTPDASTSAPAPSPVPVPAPTSEAPAPIPNATQVRAPAPTPTPAPGVAPTQEAAPAEEAPVDLLGSYAREAKEMGASLMRSMPEGPTRARMLAMLKDNFQARQKELVDGAALIERHLGAAHAKIARTATQEVFDSFVQLARERVATSAPASTPAPSIPTSSRGPTCAAEAAAMGVGVARAPGMAVNASSLSTMDARNPAYAALMGALSAPYAPPAPASAGASSNDASSGATPATYQVDEKTMLVEASSLRPSSAHRSPDEYQRALAGVWEQTQKALRHLVFHPETLPAAQFEPAIVEMLQAKEA